MIGLLYEPLYKPPGEHMSYAELSVDEKIRKSEAKQQKAREYQLRLRRVATAEAEVPSAWNSGEHSKKKLAAAYNVSTMTISRILADNGIATPIANRLTTESRKEIVALLVQGEEGESVANAYGVSYSTVRKLGIEAGVIKKGVRKPHRTDAEYAVIQALDNDIRARFGAGLYLLGTGLRAWEERKRRDAAEDASGAGGIPQEEVSAELLTQGNPIGTPAASPEGWPEVSDPTPGYPVVGEGEAVDAEGDFEQPAVNETPAPAPAAQPADEPYSF